MFLAWQRVRGTNFREDHVHLDAALRKFITASGADPHEVKGFAPLASEDDLKAFHLGFLERNSSAMAVHMVDKRWLLFETDAQHPFWLSDNPVVLHNDEDLGPRGNIGLAVPGIQVYLPVSPTLLLGLLCFSQEAKIRAAEQVHASFCAEWRANGEYNPAVDEIIFENIARGAAPLRRAILNAIDGGTPVCLTPANVTFLNSLQVLWAERYVFSALDDFSLAWEMTASSPDVRHGRRMTIA